ncbi:hypothetical protein VTK73DRAFT_729 [Phialemonium thermophilum]|uniref:Up-regulated during septation protein 1 domain-containing protein n=1 Tax=Phialemonium thermophilum TaxID=223376 RepID=A0ABR3XDV5_9PEZI
MAHIVSCMLDADADHVHASLEHYIANEVSPLASSNSLLDKASSQGVDKLFSWKMYGPERKYQLFPKDRQPSAPPGKSLDPEQAFALAMGQNGDKSDKQAGGNGLRIRIKEHNLIRRRKVSVPELGPMTTVQEVAMDSPTIPGRPPLHERSISAPGSSWKQHNLSESLTFFEPQTPAPAENERSGPTTGEADQPLSQASKQPLSPKSLTPLVIPTISTSTLPRLAHQSSLGHLRAGSTSLEPPIRSAKADDSPKTRAPFTPLSASASISTPMSAATSAVTASTLPTPVSAPLEVRSSPKPWEKPGNYTLVTTPRDSSKEPRQTVKADTDPRTARHLGHRRNQSESGSIMERGRPRKRSDTVNGPVPKRTASKRSRSEERRAFAHLPKGWRICEAINVLGQAETAAIQKQALQQAARFEILRKDDVDNLSRELRHLDERTEYLRRTYTSLRAGRRNLHSRICQYLRSPRTAKFSHDSMLKQEEALAELDASIDDWVTKLEQAENRRTRVRQKLLEHVAAAATLPIQTLGVAQVSETLQLAMGVRHPLDGDPTGNLSTPPRSPVKTSFQPQPSPSSSPSPHRVVAQVPSTILEQPLFEEAAALGMGFGNSKEEDKAAAATAASLRRAETIRIYADNDVYALLADVENQITKMSAGENFSMDTSTLSEEDHKELHRARSQELLSGSGLKSSAIPPSAGAPACFTQESAKEEVFLTSAVFKPQTTAVGG